MHHTQQDATSALDAGEPIHGVTTHEVEVATGDTAWHPDGDDVDGHAVVRYSRYDGAVSAVVNYPDAVETWTAPA